MRDFLTTGDLARASDYSPERIRQKWADGTLPAELINPGGKHLRFKKTQRLLDWCAERAGRRRRSLARKRLQELLGADHILFEFDRQFRLWRDQIGESWRDWSKEEIKEVHDKIAEIVGFLGELRSRSAERDHLA
jgi:hypothetical protein